MNGSQRDNFRNVLDFGCGVGRLIIPLAEHADNVVGIDASESMLREARKNCRKFNVTNVELATNLDSELGDDKKFDLVHTYIVLQHIRPIDGYDLIRRLVECLDDNGIGVLHITFFETKRYRKFRKLVRDYVPFSNKLINLKNGQKASYPRMEMNIYSLNVVFKILYDFNCSIFSQELTDHGGTIGTVIYFNREL
ncbi:class I SAM-dependent methyltransferase [Salinisphaera sp. SPP-AMP-43]|uniref:class I SAM-dependent methyltransferase n=1 Tax=Salinisphaera sp. SPP-AMP-43 TaxID=3121288 RepID=UPI003C6E7696